MPKAEPLAVSRLLIEALKEIRDRQEMLSVGRRDMADGGWPRAADRYDFQTLEVARQALERIGETKR